LIQQLTDNPILLAVALILVAVGGYTMVKRIGAYTLVKRLGGYTLVKRLWKPALALLVPLAGYIGYLVETYFP